MEIIYGNALVKKIRELSDNVKKRIWIASPYIGSWTAVRKILGRKWVDNATVDVKLLIDIYQNGGINLDTFKHFRYRGEIKTIRGLHAKIYIIENLLL